MQTPLSQFNCGDSQILVFTSPGRFSFVILNDMDLVMSFIYTLMHLTGFMAGTLLQVLELLKAMRPAVTGGQPPETSDTSPSLDSWGNANSAQVCIHIGYHKDVPYARGGHPLAVFWLAQIRLLDRYN